MRDVLDGKVAVSQIRSLSEPASLARKVAELERLAAQGESGAVIECLGAIVPTFHPVRINGSKVESLKALP